MSIIISLFIAKPSSAQGIYGGYVNKSSYNPISVETREQANVRRSHNKNVTYSTYEGAKSYCSVRFKSSTGYLTYALYNNGYIWDEIHQVSGYYFVGEQAEYKTYKVYIRWDHGGETWGTLSYGERTDGWPKFRINYGSRTYIYSPIVE